MDTESFFKLILPKDGNRVIVHVTDRGVRQWKRSTNHDAAVLVEKLDKSPGSVYHGCAAYDDGLTEKGKPARAAGNVTSVKAFWLDVDCGEKKPYADQDEALTAVHTFCKLLKLWNPYVVKSGRGLHVYWVLELPITPDEWVGAAQLLKQVCVHAGLHAGPERTADIASILRPVGSTHRKGDPLPVEMFDVGSAGPFTWLLAQLRSYADSHSLGSVEFDVDLGPRPQHVPQSSNSDLVYTPDFGPPPAVDAIVAGCAIIREFQTSGGCIEEPLWRAALSVVKLTENGEATCHAWSSAKYKGYSFSETQAKIDGIQGGAALCSSLATFRPDACATCPHSGKIRSPIALGRAPDHVEPITELPDPEDPEQTIEIPELPPGFSFTMDSNGKGYLLGPVKQKDDQVVPKQFAHVLFYPIGKFVSDEGAVLQMRAHLSATRITHFDLPMAYTADVKKLCTRLAANEISAVPGRELLMNTYVQEWMSKLLDSIGEKAFDQFGWTDTKDFIIGDTMFSPGGVEKQIVLAENIRELAKDFVPTGTLAGWVNTIDRAYNHKGLEDLQFAILAGLASPLVKMFNDYGGLLVYLHTDGSGNGKTTVERAALAAWCSWRSLQLTDKQATLNAIYTRLGDVSNMPLVIDEMTHMQNDVVGDMVHLISSGNPKSRCNTKGAVISRNARWENIVISSGNLLLSEKLGQHRVSNEAERARIFEYTIPEIITRSPVDTVEAMSLFPRLSENYGHAGRMIARYVVDNYDAVKEDLTAAQEKLQARFKFTSKERYWSILLSSVVTMHSIALHLKLIKFPMPPMLQFISKAILSNRGSLATSVVSHGTLFSQMLNELWQGMIVTQGEGNLYMGWDAFVEQHPRGAVVGRVITQRAGPQGQQDQPVIYLSSTVARSWCNKRGVTAKELFNSLAKSGVIKPSEAPYNLGKGSRQYKDLQRTPCWVINSSAIGAVGAVPSAPTLTVVKGGKGKV